ncbi:MAG: Cof-type HAD-IIB family hydrolase, partial [Clostridia bacterium]|nr:Cof-type HAD-IIB family hydrolase [Clostridia bacterium]
MIKLIACDLDGTLLPPSKVMPEETFPLIRKLAEKGVVFAPASGRQLPNLKKLFAPVLDVIAIIAENGGLVWYGGEIIYSDPTPANDVERALDIIRGVDGLYPVLSCKDCAYYEDDYPRFVEILKRSYSSEKKVQSLSGIAAKEDALKISVWDDKPAAEHGGIVLPPLIDGLRTMISGYDWIDVSIAHANKGRALNALMQYLGVEKGECAAFGDHMNDYEMLVASGQPYVTANAFPKLKSLVGEEIPSNADFGVIMKLKEII